MKQALVNAMSAEQIIRYLLNELPEEEGEQFEKRSLTDRQLFEYMQAVEDDLADDYVRGRLSAERKHRFEQIYKAMPGGRESIAFASELKGILGEYNVGDLPETKVLTKQPIREFFDSIAEGWQSWVANHRFSWAIPAIAMLLVVIGTASIYMFYRMNQQLGNIQTELAQALTYPSPIYQQVDGNRTAAVYFPITWSVNDGKAAERGLGGGKATPRRSTVKIPIRGNLTELRFQLSNREFDEYDSYIIELQPDQNPAVKPVILERLKAHKSAQEPALTAPLRVSDFPKDAVTKYLLTCRGRGKDGKERLMEKFPVEVDTKEQ
jgi:hypothetical protein